MTKRKMIKDWNNFVSLSSEFISENTIRGRTTLKYRNKAPAFGKLYLTNDNKSLSYKFTDKTDLDKLDPYLRSLLHMLVNKPIEENKSDQKINIINKKNKKEKKIKSMK